jgi:large subunit ribosomal protein L31
MRKNTHPDYHETVIICNTCKTEYKLGTSVDGVRVELCANCHPFYTGKEMLVDTDNLVDKFNKKLSAAKPVGTLVSKKQKRLEKKKSSTSQTLTLKDMLAQIK